MEAAAAAPSEFQVLTGKQKAPWKILIYGTPGVGKSTLAAQAPGHIFFDLENGLSRVDCTRTPSQLRSLDDIRRWVGHVADQPQYQTIIFDTVDELDRMLSARVVDQYNLENRNKVRALGDIPYGRGGDLLVAEWKKIVDTIEWLNARGKNVIMTGHEQIVKFENPTDANFDFYTVNVHKKAAPVLIAKMDAALFVRHETFVRNADDGKGKAQATGERIVLCEQGSSWVAKNRFGLPARMMIKDFTFEKIQ